MLLVPAMWNGFPFIFYDSKAYIDQALGGSFVPERSIFYAWFLRAFAPNLGLWPSLIAQSLLTAAVVAIFVRYTARYFGFNFSSVRYLVVIAALCAFTALPWIVGEVMPDFLTGLLVLAVYILSVHGRAMAWPTRIFLFAVSVLATTAHASHLALAAGLAAVVAVFSLLVGRLPVSDKEKFPAPNWSWSAAVFAFSLTAIVAGNYARTGETFVSRSGPGFMLARLMQDGIVQRLLADTCPDSGYVLCAYKDNLPTIANDWLWGADSPFKTLGGFEGTADESARIVRTSLALYPVEHMKAAILNTATQFSSFASGDGFEAMEDGDYFMLFTGLGHGQIAQFTSARQIRSALPFESINRVHVILATISVGALVGGLILAVTRRRFERAFLYAYILLALLGNAFICGVFSGAHDRYQSRLVWIAGLVLLVAARPRAVHKYVDELRPDRALRKKLCAER